MANLEEQSPDLAGLQNIGHIFWRWYDAHENDSWPIKVWIISTRIKVKDLKGLFERIFGRHP